MKKMFYRVEQEVAELIILMMQVAFTEGTEVIVRYLRELYLIDLKLPNNQAVEQLNLRALGRGEALPESLPDLLFQESARDNQFTRMIRSLPALERQDGGLEILSELLLDEETRRSAVRSKFRA